MDFNDGKIPGPSRMSKPSGALKVDLREVVNIFKRDPEFIQNWRKFYYSLETPSPNFDQWDKSYNNTSKDIEEILIKILSHWVMSHGKEATVGRLYAVLVTEKFVSVAEALKDEYPDLSCAVVQLGATTGSNQSGKTNPGVDRPIAFELCKPTEKFVGRANEIEMLETFFQQKKKLVVVSGLGGVGKSELVRTFGIHFLNIVPGSCIWIHGDNEESFKTSMKQLAAHVHHKFKADKDTVDIFIEVYNRKLKKWPILIIIDNVDRRNSLVENLIQSCKRLLENIPLIIVTTRNKLVLNNAGENIELEMLNPDESVKMVTDGLGSCVSVSDATKLSETLGHFPLVLQQAISFIKHKRTHSLRKNFGVSEYLELFHKDQTKMMDYPLNVDYNYNSTTFRAWRLTLDDIKQMNGTIGVMALDILSMLAYIRADGVYLSKLIRFYKDAKHKGDTEESKPDSEEVEKAVELIQTYSMCRVQNTEIWRCKISSHRLIRDFIRSTCDTEMNRKVLRKMILENKNPYLNIDTQNVCKLGQRYKTLVSEMFIEFWKLDVDEQICASEIYKTSLNQALETDGLEIQFVLNDKGWIDPSLLSQALLQNCHKIYEFVRHWHGLDHELTQSIWRLFGVEICKKGGLSVNILTLFFVDMIDGRCVSEGTLLICFVEIMVAFQNINVTKQTTEVLMVLKESVTNNSYLYEGGFKLFTLTALAMISNQFKRNGDSDLFNQIQCEMFCLMEHPNELTEAWEFVEKTFHLFSFPAKALLFQNCDKTIDIRVFKPFIYQLQRFLIAEDEQVVQLLDFLIESKQICRLDVFAYVTLYWSEEKGHCDQTLNFSSPLESNIFNKELLTRVIKTIKDYTLFLLDKDEFLLVSLCTEIMDGVKKGLVNRYEGIWSLAEIIKCLQEHCTVSNAKLVELIDILEGLVSNDNQNDLFKRKMYTVQFDNILGYLPNRSILLFLRLQKYGLHLTMLKMILSLYSVENVVAIGNNIIENHREGFINKSDSYLAIKYVVKSLIKDREKDKSIEILFKTLDIEQCPSSVGNPDKSLFEKVQLIVVNLDDINIAIATFLYLVEFIDINDSRGFWYPSIILRQILRILTETQSPTKLLALCYEIYHFSFDWNNFHLCWTLIQILNGLVKMNKNELAEQFLTDIIKEAKTDEETETDDEFFWFCKACWFIVFGIYYDSELDIDADLDMQKVKDYVTQLGLFETSWKAEETVVYGEKSSPLESIASEFQN